MNNVCVATKISQKPHQGSKPENGGSYPCFDDFSPEIVLGWPEYKYDSAVDQVVARYYDATIGRFISADTIVPNPYNPQSLNRYSYCLNNPLRYIDPSGYDHTAAELAATDAWSYVSSTMKIKSFGDLIAAIVMAGAINGWIAPGYYGQVYGNQAVRDTVDAYYLEKENVSIYFDPGREGGAQYWAPPFRFLVPVPRSICP